jgi:hypothetical protein
MTAKGVLAVVWLVGCGGKGGNDGAATLPHNAPTATASVPGGACREASFAALDACATQGACVRLFDVTPECEVITARELTLPGVEEIIDVAWPRASGSLWVVARRDVSATWVWAEVRNPRTASDKELAAVRWAEAKLGESDPEGFQYGVETDGKRVILTGCTSWVSDNEEEWHCDGGTYRALDKSAIDHLPPPSFAKPGLPGKAITGVTLHAGDDHMIQCEGGEYPESVGWGTPIGYEMLDGGRYVLFYENVGSRGGPNIAVESAVLKGCKVDGRAEGEAVVGPAGYWANLKDRYTTSPHPWRIYRASGASPLMDSTNAPFGVEAKMVTWALE